MQWNEIFKCKQKLTVMNSTSTKAIFTASISSKTILQKWRWIEDTSSLKKKSWNDSLLEDLPKRNTRENSLCWKGMTSDCNTNPTVCLFKARYITLYCWAYIDMIYVTIKAHREVENVKIFLFISLVFWLLCVFIAFVGFL